MPSRRTAALNSRALTKAVCESSENDFGRANSPATRLKRGKSEAIAHDSSSNDDSSDSEYRPPLGNLTPSAANKRKVVFVYAFNCMCRLC